MHFLFITASFTDYTVDGRNICFPPHFHRMWLSVTSCVNLNPQKPWWVLQLFVEMSHKWIQRRFGTTCHETPLSTLPTWLVLRFYGDQTCCAQDRYSVSTYECRLHTWGLCSQSTEDDISCEMRIPFRFGTAPPPNRHTHTHKLWLLLRVHVDWDDKSHTCTHTHTKAVERKTKGYHHLPDTHWNFEFNK